MLDGVDGKAAVAQAGGVIEAREVLQSRGNADTDIVTIEADAVLGRGGLEIESDRLAGVKTDAGTAQRSAQRPSGGPRSPGSAGAYDFARVISNRHAPSGCR